MIKREQWVSLRELAGITTQDLANDMFVSRATISAVENGKSGLSTEHHYEMTLLQKVKEKGFIVNIHGNKLIVCYEKEL